MSEQSGKDDIMTGVMALVLLAVATPHLHAQSPDAPPQIGAKHRIKFSPTYSCRPTAEFYERGYQGTALFLSDAMRRRNSPDLVFNGACGSENYFQSATHGGNLSLVADLGVNPPTSGLSILTSLDPRSDHAILKQMGFRSEVPVVPAHTYVVLIDKHGIRGLFVFTVTNHVKDKSVELTYEVLDYRATKESPAPPARVRQR